MKSYIFDIGGVLLNFDIGFISERVAGGSAEKLEQVRRISSLTIQSAVTATIRHTLTRSRMIRMLTMAAVAR